MSDAHSNPAIGIPSIVPILRPYKEKKNRKQITNN